MNNFGQIEEEILSRTLPVEWGKIEIGHICYQKSTNAKADHFDLKSSDAITAFIIECEKYKNVQLCVYATKQIKRKQLICGSSVIENDIEESVPKKICVIFYFLCIYYNIYLFIYISIKNFNFNYIRLLLIHNWMLPN